MDVFVHHIYEYKKGLRRMVLHTTGAEHRGEIVCKLLSLGIDHHVVDVHPSKINVFFGDPRCIAVIRSFEHLDLSRLSDEQDFIMGTLLGYDTLGQCRRYLKRKGLASALREAAVAHGAGVSAVEGFYVN